MKLVLTHSSIDDESLLLASFNTDCIVKQASEFVDADSVLGSLENLDNISHLAFVYKSNGSLDIPFFSSSLPSADYSYFNEEIIKLIRELKINNAGLIVDILTCNLNTPEFAESVTKLEADLNVDIRYSLDQTGNSPNGNWVLESDNVDVKTTYFTELINIWEGILDIVAGGIATTAIFTIVYDSNYIYIGGQFTAVIGASRNYLARYSKDGTLDTAWNPNVNGNVRTIVMDDTYVYIGGEFTTVGGTGRNRLARVLKTTGALDAWNPNVNSTGAIVYSLALDTTNSLLYVGGSFTAINGSARNNLACVPTDSVTITAWNPNVSSASAVVYSIILDSANSLLYIGGSFTQLAGTTTRNNLARVSTVTGVADSWDPNVSSANAIVNTIALDSANSLLYVGGSFSQIGGSTTRNNIARVSTNNGAVDSWDPNVNNIVRTITQSSTYVYIGGDFTTLNNSTVSRNRIMRILKTNTTGAVNTDSWYLNTNGYVAALAFDNDMLYVGGAFLSMTSLYMQSQTSANRFAIVNLTTLKLSMPTFKGFNINGAAYVAAIIDNYVYVGGAFTNVNNTTVSRLVRFSKTTGMFDSTWIPSVNGPINAITYDNTYIYIGGIFTSVDSSTRNRVARFVRSTGILDSWDPNISGGTTTSVNTIVSDNTNVYIGGQFTTVGTGADMVTRNNIVRVSATTGIADSWDPNINTTTAGSSTNPVVNSIALDSVNSFVYIGGFYNQINGATTRNNISRVPTNSSTVDSWNPSANNTVSIVVVDNTNNYLYIGGLFTTITSTPRSRIVRYVLSSGALDAWNPVSGSGVRAITPSGSNVYIGGAFPTIGVSPNNFTRNNIARVSASTGIADSWNPNLDGAVQSILVDGSNIYIAGFMQNVGNAGASDLYGNITRLTMTNTYLTNGRATLSANGITDQTAITSKVVNQNDIVTDNFIDFTSPTISANTSAVRHALLSLLQEYNYTVTKFYMPRANLGLSGSGNVQVYIPYNNVDISTITATNPVYVNLYVENDYTTFTSGSTTKTITKTASGYLLDGVTYTDGQTATVFLNYTITFGGVYITQNDVIITIPDAPTNVSATADNAQSTVSWTAPVNNGNSAILDYTVTSSPGGITATTADGSTTSVVVTGLTNGTAYTFTVTARNIAGSSAASSASSPVTPKRVPDAPTSPSVSYTLGQTSASVSFTAPANNGGASISGYTVTATSSDGGTTRTGSDSASPITVSNLTVGKTYTFTVTATNSVGTGAPSSATSPSILIVTVPDAPSNVIATPGYAEATLSWDAPIYTGGTSLTGYTVTSDPDNITVTTTNTYVTVPNLTIGKSYMFTIFATNIAGNSTDMAQPLDPITINGSSTLNPTLLKQITTGTDLIGYTLVVCATPNTNPVATRYFELSDGYVGTSAVVQAYLGATPNSNSNSNRSSFIASHAGSSVQVRADATTYTTVTPRLHIVSAYIASATSIKVNQYYYDNSTLTEVTLSTNTLTCDSSLLGKLTSFWLGRSVFIAGPYLNGSFSQVAFYPGDLSANSPTTKLLSLIQSPNTNTYDSNTYIFGAAPGFNGVAVQRFGTTATPSVATSSSITLNPSGSNYLNMMNIIVSAPTAPTNVSATVDNAQSTISWTAPEYNGGSSILDYTVTSSDGQTVTTADGSTTSALVTGLTNGSSYTFTVTARNTAGSSPSSSPSSAVTPRTIPDAPSKPTTESGDTNIVVSWSAPSNNGGNAISNYKLRYSTNAGAEWSSAIDVGAILTYNVTGLSDNTSYVFQVAAENEAGAGDWSTTSDSSQTVTTPSAPQNIALTAQQASIKVEWEAPSNNGGSAITGYTIRYRVQGTLDALTQIDNIDPQNASTTKTYTITGLIKDTVYDVYVYAFNAIDVNKQGAVTYASATPYDVPGTPQTVAAISSSESVTITFTSANANGSSITSYTVTGTDLTTNTVISPVVANVPVSSITITGLTNTHKYSFLIVATNEAGDGEPSSIIAVPIDPTATSIDVSTIIVSTASEAVQILNSVTDASSTVIEQIAEEIISQLAADSSVSAILSIMKDIRDLLTNTALILAIGKAAGRAAVSSTLSSGSNISDRLDDYKQRISNVKTAVIADGSLDTLVQCIVQGAIQTILDTSDSLSTRVGVALLTGNLESGATRTDIKTASVAAVEEKASGTTIQVSGDVLDQIKASIPADRKTADLDAITAMNVIVANKTTKVVMLPSQGDAWYIPMIPNIEYTLGNSRGSETAIFIFNAATNTLTKDGVAFTAGSQLVLNNVTYPSYAIGSFTGGITPPSLQPKPIEVNLNVTVDVDGALEILGYSPITPSNIVIATNLLPVDALYDEAAGIALIEFWEPDDMNDIMAKLNTTHTLGGIEGYKITAKKLALGLQNVLVGELNAKYAEPFNNTRYGASGVENGDRVMVGFGRLTLMAYSHYILGHVQATAAITNDSEFIKGMLSLNSDVLTSYKHAPLDNYDSLSEPWTIDGTAFDANLAIRLVHTLITNNLTDNNPATSLVSDGVLTSVANIVQQVIGQDASRATDEDNNKYSPENHGLLRFYPGDVIFVVISLTTPDVTVGTGQLVGEETLKDLYSNSPGNKKYTIKITIGEAST